MKYIPHKFHGSPWWIAAELSWNWPPPLEKAAQGFRTKGAGQTLWTQFEKKTSWLSPCPWTVLRAVLPTSPRHSSNKTVNCQALLNRFKQQIRCPQKLTAIIIIIFHQKKYSVLCAGYNSWILIKVKPLWIKTYIVYIFSIMIIQKRGKILTQTMIK